MAFVRFPPSILWPRLAFLTFLGATGAGWSFAQQGAHTRDAAATSVTSRPAGSQVPAEAALRTGRRTPGARLREGTEISEVPGQFLPVDGRFEFVSSDGGFRLRLLENLALERASRKVDESSLSVVWRVSGVVTEYQGANYLLVKRIVVESGVTHASP